jgi:signal transduction histidine kinase
MTEQPPLIEHLHLYWRIPSLVVILILAPFFPLFSQHVVQKAAAVLLAEGKACLDEEEFKLASEFLTEALGKAQDERDTVTQVEAHYHYALARFWLADYQSSNKSLYLLLNNYHKALSKLDSMDILRMVSQNHFYMGNYDVAHEIALKRLRVTEMEQDSYNIALSHQVLSEIEVRQKDYENALEHVQQSSAIFEALHNTDQLSFNMDLMGDIYHNTGRYEEALSFKIRSCQVVDTTGSLYDNAYCNYTIALTLSKLGRVEEALSLFKLALASFRKAGLPEETALTKACLGETLTLDGQCDEGIAMLRQALGEAEGLSMSPLRRDVLEKMVQASKQCGLIEGAFFYLEKYIAVNDSLNNQNTKVRIANLSNQYELEKKNAEVVALTQKEKYKTRFILSLLAGLVLLFGFLVVGYFLLKKQRSYSRQLDAKNAQIELQIEDIHQANEKLKNANLELEQFAYLASHDLKAPLRTIGNYASLINRRYAAKLDEDGVTFLKFITEAAKHMNALLEDIFAYSKLGKGELQLEEVNLEEKFHLSLRLLHETIEASMAKITSDQLPTVFGNPTQLYQLVQNLLDNALKFVPQGRNPEIALKATDIGNAYHFQVQDNGIGIPPAKQEEVFTIFKRLHSREAYSGTGIGLAICKKIVEAHGGSIWVESDGMSGTTFHFTLRKAPHEISLVA